MALCPSVYVTSQSSVKTDEQIELVFDTEASFNQSDAVL